MTPELWDEVEQNVVKTVFTALNITDRALVLEVWGRSLRNTKEKTSPSLATSVQFHFRIHRSQASSMLVESGKSFAYLTPKTDDKLSHQDWSLIWYKDKTEANIALSRVPSHAGMARTKDKWAVRVPVSNFEAALQELKPGDDPKQTVMIKLMFKIQPVPAGTTQKKLGKDAFLIGAECEPPHAHVYLNDTLLLIKPVGKDKVAMPAHPLLAGPKQFKDNKHVDKPTEKQELLVDSWALFRAKNGLQTHGNPSAGAASGSGNPTPARAATAVDPPIAAKFAAFEKRLANAEAGLEKLSTGQNHLCQQMDHAGKQLGAFEHQLHEVQSSIQGGIEQAFAKSVHEQNRRLDSKFQQLVQLLQNPVSKRALPDDDDDAEMESPVKPPASAAK
eukprot:Skav225481  [mRNA]  locus=scaffold3604:428376:429542:+ [translate_table: standard]